MKSARFFITFISNYNVATVDPLTLNRCQIQTYRKFKTSIFQALCRKTVPPLAVSFGATGSPSLHFTQEFVSGKTL